MHPFNCSLNYFLVLYCLPLMFLIWFKCFLFSQSFNVHRDHAKKILANITAHFIYREPFFFLPACGNLASVLDPAVDIRSCFAFKIEHIIAVLLIHNICICLICRWLVVLIFAERQNNSSSSAPTLIFLFDQTDISQGPSSPVILSENLKISMNTKQLLMQSPEYSSIL